MMKRIWLLSLIPILLLLAGCERTATRSSWSPINSAATAPATMTLPATLAVSDTATAAGNPTAAAIGPLDESTLPAQLPASPKGYELYSWQNGAGWNFTLITGTNRSKAFDEIIAPGNSFGADGFVKISVSGLEDLKQVLKRLPKGESILWGGMDLGNQVAAGMVYLTFPPQSTMDEVAAYCTNLQLTLTSLKSQ